MPSVVGPLFSLDAKGTIGKAITFQGKKEGSRAGLIPRHSDTQSTKQLSQRAYFKQAVAYWRTLNNTYRGYWNNWVKG